MGSKNESKKTKNGAKSKQEIMAKITFLDNPVKKLNKVLSHSKNFQEKTK